MKYILKTFLIVIMALLPALPALAYDFMVDGIAYNITSPITVEVTYTAHLSSSNYSGGLTEANIPTSVTNDVTTYAVTAIGSEAFWHCCNLTSFTIPNSVTEIGERVFCYCSGLASIDIPNSVTSIGVGAFGYCSGLTSVTIPNTVTSIGAYTFRSCTGLTSIEIPNSITSISSGLFCDCTGLTSVTIPNTVTTIDDSAFSGCYNLTSIEIPNSVTTIGRAFQYCHNLNSIAIPNSVISISGYAFTSCSGLKKIIVEDGNTVYDSRNNCNAIIETKTNTLLLGCKTTIIPNSVTSIGRSAFIGCTGLTSIAIPNSVTSIGGYAFSCCSGLTSITIPNSVTSIGEFAFCDCDGLTSITIPNSLTTIDDYAFSRCDGFTSIEIPNSVTSIGVGAFSFSDYLTSITIPNSVTSIGNNAFRYCISLSKIHCRIKEPLNIDSNVFNYVPTGTCTLYVPVGCAEVYRNAPVWSDFTNIVEEPADKIWVDDFSIMHGETAEVEVQMQNENEIVGFQLDISLPDGITLMQEDDEYIVDLTDRKARNHTVTSNLLPSDDIRVFVSSITSKPFSGNDGAILRLKLNAADDFTGRHNLYLKNIICAASDGTRTSFPDSSCIVSGVQFGDVNGDGIVDVADVVALANHVMGDTPEGFDITVANINGDAIIDVSDVVALANVVMGAGE